MLTITQNLRFMLICGIIYFSEIHIKQVSAHYGQKGAKMAIEKIFKLLTPQHQTAIQLLGPNQKVEINLEKYPKEIREKLHMTGTLRFSRGSGSCSKTVYQII